MTPAKRTSRGRSALAETTNKMDASPARRSAKDLRANIVKEELAENVDPDVQEIKDDMMSKSKGDISPDETSDYGSEVPSRAPSLSPGISRSVTPESTAADSNQQDEGRASQHTEDSKAGMNVALLRKAGDIKDEDEEEETEADSEVAAALKAGLLSAEAVKEEELAKENNEAALKNRKEPEITEKSQGERYKMLMDLLQKSEFFTNYLKQKMNEDSQAQELKKKKALEKQEKNKDKEKAQPARGRRSIGGGGKGETKGPGKRPAEEEASEAELRAAKKAKIDVTRNFKGELISDRQPRLLTGGVMRNYQLEGYEWLAKLYENGINGILADEMGLGKTIQCIALFCHLYEMGVPGPFLVVAPLSTIPNWVNEFNRFSPDIPCVLYHGTKQRRTELRSQIGKTFVSDELVGKMHNVVVTSYEIAMNDRVALANVRWKFLVVDEGHRLKNMECRLIRELKQYKTEHRLLLTGTPLQNNLRELFSLLNFVIPEIFDDVQVFESWFDAKEIEEDAEGSSTKILAQEQANSVVNMLHQIILPFLRRRVKADVGLEIPPKKELLVYCPLTPDQKEMYQAVVERTIAELISKTKEEEPDLDQLGKGKRAKEKVDYSVFDEESSTVDDRFEEALWKLTERRKSSASTAYKMDLVTKNEQNFSIKSRMMDMRKSVNHPYLIDYPITDDGFYKTDEDLVNICGKLRVLDQMLTELIKRGHKILLFSQMTRMLDILGDYLNLRSLKFSRLDGSMNFVDRQANIDRFNADPSVPVFLLSTRAGGLGINLTAADTCIIYDSDWNPQQDLQAQDRCHRIGQTKPVMVYRLVTRGTIDEKIVLRAAAKRKIEKLVIHKDKFCSVSADAGEAARLKIDPKELLQLLHSKDYAGAVTCAEGKVLSDPDLALLLDRSNLAWGGKLASSRPAAKVEGVFHELEDTDLGENNLQSVIEG